MNRVRSPRAIALLSLSLALASCASTATVATPTTCASCGQHAHGGEACLHCQACVKSCPVLLDPMHLAQGIGARGGMSIADVPGGNHCLKCGDCVQACEFMIEKAADRRGISEVPLWLGAPRKKAAGDGGAGTKAQGAGII